MAQTVLVVDDEQDVLDLVVYHLQKAGYKTLTASNGASALETTQTYLPSLVLLDLMLPSIDGTEVCKTLKANSKTSHIPIIMLTAKAEEVDRILGLELGADDYVTKPFSPRELMLRVKSLLRRTSEPKAQSEILKHDDLALDNSRHEVTFKGKRVDITATEFKLLRILMERRGRVQTRERLLVDVWDYTPDTDTRTVDTYVSRLREKLGKASDYIETVRSVGYRFISD